MTANVLPEQTAAALDAGMNDVVHKPFSGVQIFSVLERLAAPGARRASPSVPAQRSDVLARLTSLIGDKKVKDLLASLATSLSTRFDAQAAMRLDAAALRSQAHASVASAGMLGFMDLAEACQAVSHAQRRRLRRPDAGAHRACRLRDRRGETACGERRAARGVARRLKLDAARSRLARGVRLTAGAR